MQQPCGRNWSVGLGLGGALGEVLLQPVGVVGLGLREVRKLQHMFGGRLEVVAVAGRLRQDGGARLQERDIVHTSDCQLVPRPVVKNRGK